MSSILLVEKLGKGGLKIDFFSYSLSVFTDAFRYNAGTVPDFPTLKLFRMRSEGLQTFYQSLDSSWNCSHLNMWTLPMYLPDYICYIVIFTPVCVLSLTLSMSQRSSFVMDDSDTEFSC